MNIYVSGNDNTRDAVAGNATIAKKSTTAIARLTKDLTPKRLMKLTGIYLKIKPLVKTQRVRYGTEMIKYAKAMLKMDRKIFSRLETHTQLDGDLIDHINVDPKTGCRKQRSSPRRITWTQTTPELLQAHPKRQPLCRCIHHDHNHTGKGKTSARRLATSNGQLCN